MRIGLGIASVALVVLSACGGSEDPKASEKSATTSDAPALKAVDWPASCEAVDQSASNHLNGGMPTADDYKAFAVEVEELLAGVSRVESKLLIDVAGAGRLSAEAEVDPNSGPDEYLEARGAMRDSLDALAVKCAAEGSSALS